MKRSMRPRVVLAAVAAATGAACGGAGPGSTAAAWSGSVRDSAGITIVSNPAEGVWRADNRWSVSEELRIGTMAGDPDYQFGQISGIAELSDGRLAVLDAQAQHLRIFSSDGTHLATIGGPGSGPGEFGPAAGPVLIGPGDSIFVPDATNARLNKFTPEAEPVGSSPLDFSGGFPILWLDTPDGLLVNQFHPFAQDGQTAADSVDVILARGPDGAVMDTLITFPMGRTFVMRDGMPVVTFFSAEPMWTITSTGGIAYGSSDEYRIGIYDGDRLTRILEKPFSRAPVSEVDQALLKTAMARAWQDIGMPPEALQIMTDAIGFAELYPAYASIRGGPAGSVWVQHLRTPSDMPEDQRETFDPTMGFGGSEWDVFDPEGRFLGELEMPERFQPIRIDGNRLYGISRDELDVQYVVVLRVHRTEADLESDAG